LPLNIRNIILKVFAHLSGIINPFLLTILYISVSRISFIVPSLVLYVRVFSPGHFLDITSGNIIFQVVSS